MSEIPAELPEELHRSFLRLRRTNPARKAVERVCAGEWDEALYHEMTAALLNPMGGRWHERLLAAWALRFLPIASRQRRQAIAILTSTLTQPIPGSRELRTCVTAGIVGLALVWYWTVLAPPFLGLSYRWSHESLDGALLFVIVVGVLVGGVAIVTWPIVSAFATLWERKAQAAVRRQVISTLGELGGRDEIGLLTRYVASGPLGAAAAGSRERHTRALAALTAILRRLTAAERAEVHIAQLRELAEILPSAPPEPGLAILECLADARCLRAEERVASAARTSRHPEVAAKAREVLALFAEEKERARNQKTLLRPSEAPKTKTDHLLRATASSGSEPPEQLLRPL